MKSVCVESGVEGENLKIFVQGCGPGAGPGYGWVSAVPTVFRWSGAGRSRGRDRL